MSKNGLHLITPSSISYIAISATITANGSVTFTAGDSITLNGVFSALYDNYRIVMRVTDVDGTGLWNARLTQAGVPSAVNYNNQFLNADGTVVSASRTTGATSWLPTSSTLSISSPSGIIMDIYGPYLTSPTAMRSITTHASGSSSVKSNDCAGVHSSTASWDGVELFGVGVSGRIAVYGMRN